VPKKSEPAEDAGSWFDEEAVTHAASSTFSENEQQIICCGARFRRGGEDRSIVLLEEQQPAGDVFGIAQLPFYSEVGAQKGCAQLGNEFLDRICLGAEGILTA
jgi:hypothetical protein